MRWSPSGGPSTATAGRRARTGRSLRSSAARWARDGSPVEAAATALGLGPGSIEATLHEVLAAWRAVLRSRARGAVGLPLRDGRDGPAPERARHTRAAASDQRRASAQPRCGSQQPSASATTSSRGPGGRRSRPHSRSLATIAREAADGTWRAATPWVFATHAEGGLGNLEELLHESGHALHYAAIRARPALFDPPVADAGSRRGLRRPARLGRPGTGIPGDAILATPPARARAGSGATAG